MPSSINLVPDTVTITIIRGTTAVFNIVVQSTDVVPVPINLTGLTGTALTLLVKLAVADPDGSALITKTIGAGLTITDALNGKVTLTYVPADTSPATIPEATPLWWALKLYQPGTPQVETDVLVGFLVVISEAVTTI